MIVDMSLDKYKEVQQDGTVHFTQEDEATHLLADEITIKTLNNSVFKQEIRSYEISLWTLQDEFITVLKWSNAAHKGRIEDPEMKLDVDGTSELKFKIPMYIRIFQEKDRTNDDPRNMSRMIMKENPIWYNTQNGNLIESMRKLKVIFNKGDNDEGVFEFLITKVTESHEEDQLYCEIESEGLAFHELGKVGYKCHLSQDEYDLYIYNLQQEEPEKTLNEIIEEYPSRINYWMEECANIEPWPTDSTPNPRKWYYRIEMDWNSFSQAPLRSTSKVYEEAYVTSWEIQQREEKNYVVPVKEEVYKEKYRIIDTEDSNIYNITQTIAEKFGVFCRYEYGYDENYHIISRCIVFYNNFMKEHDIITVNYPHKAKKISRQMDGTDLTTKLFIRPIDDESTRRGTINIINSDANKMHEDYLLNFDYMRTCNGISEEQYKAIDTYEQNMALINNTLMPLQNQYTILNMKLPELESEVQILDESIQLADEQIEQQKEFEQALYEKYGNGTDTIVIDKLNPQIAMLVEKSGTVIEVEAKVASDNNDSAYSTYWNISGINKGGIDALANAQALSKLKVVDNEVKLSDDYKGIIDTTIVPYSAYDTRTKECSFPYEDFQIEYDQETGFPTKLYNLRRFKAAKETTDNLRHAYDIFGEELASTFEYAWSDNSTTNPTEWISEEDIIANSNAISPAVTITTNSLTNGKGGMSVILTPLGDNILPHQPHATLTADEKKQNRYLWQKVNHNYSKDFTISDYFIYDFGDPDSSSFYSSWIHLFYCQEENSDQILTKPNKPTESINSINSSAINGWSINPPNYYETEGKKYKYYTCWQKEKRTYVKSTKQWYDIKAQGSPVTQMDPNVTANAAVVNSSSHVVYTNGTATESYYENTLNDPVYEWTTTKEDSTYNSFSVATGKVYLTFSYKPQLYYEQIIRQWERKRTKDAEELAKKQEQLGVDNGNIEDSTGLYKTLYILEDTIQTYIDKKEELIREFEHMMGPALREGYWDAEDYSNYGDPKEAIFTTIDNSSPSILTSDTGTDAVFGWDTECFDSEDEEYYEYSIEQTKIYYPCINLLKLLDPSQQRMTVVLNKIKEMVDKLQTWSEIVIDDEDEADAATIAKKTARMQLVFSSTKLSPPLGFNNSDKRFARYAKTFVVGSNALLRFIKPKNSNQIIPVLMLVGADTLPDDEVEYMETSTKNGVKQGYAEFGISRIVNENTTGSYDADKMFVMPYSDTAISYNYVVPDNCWMTLDQEKASSRCYVGEYDVVYPHIKISSLDLKTEESQVFLRYYDNGESAIKTIKLEEYTHYSVLSRVNANTSSSSKLQPLILNSGDIITSAATENDLEQGIYESANYIAIKPEVFFRYGALPGYNVQDTPQLTSVIFNYYISNAATALYLDAKEVLEENSIPKVEYEVETNILNNDFVRTLYSRLAQIMMINDVELKFNNVFGYISGVELNLDQPDEDSIEVKNYKTKFEDLFSTIVAQTDSMKKNSGIIESLANGTLINAETIVETIKDSEELEKTLDEYMGDTNVTAMLQELWTEAGNILACSQSTLDAAYTLNMKNANILGGFAERIQDSLTPTVTRGQEPPVNFKIGDVFIELDDNGNEIGRYIGMTNSADGGTMTRTYDGALAAISGAALKIDAASGSIDILAQNMINIKSGNSIYIAANDNVDIIGNKAVNIGGARINIAALGTSVANSGITMIADAETPSSKYLDGDEQTYILSHLADLIEPYKDISDTPTYEKDAFQFAIREVYVYKDEKPQLNLGNNIYLEIGIVSDDLSKWDNGGTIPVTTSPIYNGYEKIYNFIEGWLSRLSKVSIYPQRIELNSANIYMRGANRILAVASLGSSDSTSVVDISASGGIFIGSGNSITFYSGEVQYNDETKTYSNSSGSSVEINKDHILFGVSTQDSGTAMELSQKQIILAAGATNVSNISSLTTSTITTNASYSGIQIQQNYIGMASGTGNERSLISIKPGQILIGTANGITESSFTNGVPGSGIKIATSGITIGSSAGINVSGGTFSLTNSGNTFKLLSSTNVFYLANNATWSSATKGLYFDGSNLYIKGELVGASGSFSGNLGASSINGGTITGSTISGTAISGGTITGARINSTEEIICGNFSVQKNGNVNISITEQQPTGLTFKYNTSDTSYALTMNTQQYTMITYGSKAVIGPGNTFATEAEDSNDPLVNGGVINGSLHYISDNGGTVSNPIIEKYLQLGTTNSNIQISEKGMQFRLTNYDNSGVTVKPYFYFNQDIVLEGTRHIRLRDAGGNEYKIYVYKGELRCKKNEGTGHKISYT